MTTACLFLCAPPESFNPVKDTTRVLMEEAARRDLEVWTARHEDLEVDGGRVFARARKLRVIQDGDTWFRAGNSEILPLHDLHSIWFRHDPPFDSTYLEATRMVDLVDGPLKINDPAGLRDANEKLFALRFAEWMPETLVSSNPMAIEAFIDRVGGRGVLKPLDGFGGTGIFVADLTDPNFGTVLQTATAHGTRWTMAQAWIERVHEGDMRVLLMDGRIIGQFLRVPGEREFRGNMMQGGRVEACEVSERGHAIVDAVAPVLAAHGLRLVGLDIVGDLLTEINVTSPTGFQEVRKLMGHRPETIVWDTILQEAPA
ncbi:MAG: glutathione synthase [Candidatus Dadabacteria bacterium]|nr:MAG: glutathione synthase [Candidatus Dadabacteria bacterium]